MMGQILDGRYQIVQELSSGGFGQTYLAQDMRIPGKPTCVVKQLKPQSTVPEHLEIARQLFEREANSLAQLGHHDQIPTLLAYFSEAEEFYLVQEFIDGQTLEAELATGQLWPEVKVLQMLRDVLPVLDYVHTRGVIHRDIKPANMIRRSRDQKLVLIDFGAIKQVQLQTVDSGQPPATGTRIGTVGYMASEQARGKPRPNSDLYALGMVAIQALTGRPPQFLEEDAATGEIIWRNLAQVSPGLAEVLNSMTRYHFKDRYATAQEAMAAIAYISSPVPPTMAPQPAQPSVPPTQAMPSAPPPYPPGPSPQAGSAQDVFRPNPIPAQPGDLFPRAHPAAAPGQAGSPGSYGTPFSAQPTDAIAPARPPARSPAHAPGHLPGNPAGSPTQQHLADAQPRRKPKTPLILAGLTVLAACGGGAIALFNGKGSIPAITNFLPQQSKCTATVSGNVRSAPTSGQGNNVIKELVNQAVEATGKQTPGGWMEVKLDGKTSAWAHRTVIANTAEVDRCLVGKQAVQTVEDPVVPSTARDEPAIAPPRSKATDPEAESSSSQSKKTNQKSSPSVTAEPEGSKGKTKPAPETPPTPAKLSCRCIPDAATNGGELRGDGTTILSETDLSGQVCSTSGGRSGIYQCTAP